MLGKVLFFSLSLATGAGAADLLRPSFTPSESEQSRFRWTGGYIGLHGAYGWSFIETNEVNNITGLSTFGSLRTFGGGGLAGLQAGYLVQNGYGLFGLESDASVGDLRGTFSLGAGDSINRHITALGSIRSKVGMVFDDRAAVFLSGGLALGNIHLSVIDRVMPAKISNIVSSIGFTAGFGISYFVTPRVSVSSEYRYFDLGPKKVSGNVFFDTYSYPTDNKFHTVRVSMNYHIGSGR